MHLSAVCTKSAIDIESNCCRKDPMFLLENACGKAVLRIPFCYKHSCLKNDGAGVRPLIHKVHRTSADLHPVGQCIPMGMRPRETWQQCGVDIEDASRIGTHEKR